MTWFRLRTNHVLLDTWTAVAYISTFAMLGVFCRMAMIRSSYLTDTIMYPLTPVMIPNMLGCLLIAIVKQLPEALKFPDDHIVSHTCALFATGFCGSLTSYSSLLWDDLQILFINDIPHRTEHLIIHTILAFCTAFGAYYGGGILCRTTCASLTALVTDKKKVVELERRITERQNQPFSQFRLKPPGDVGPMDMDLLQCSSQEGRQIQRSQDDFQLMVLTETDAPRGSRNRNESLSRSPNMSLSRHRPPNQSLQNKGGSKPQIISEATAAALPPKQESVTETESQSQDRDTTNPALERNHILFESSVSSTSLSYSKEPISIGVPKPEKARWFSYLGWILCAASFLTFLSLGISLSLTRTGTLHEELMAASLAWIGALSRWGLSKFNTADRPYGTFWANYIGSIIATILNELPYVVPAIEAREFDYIYVITGGILGALSTMSTFVHELHTLGDRSCIVYLLITHLATFLSVIIVTLMCRLAA